MYPLGFRGFAKEIILLMEIIISTTSQQRNLIPYVLQTVISNKYFTFIKVLASSCSHSDLIWMFEGDSFILCNKLMLLEFFVGSTQ